MRLTSFLVVLACLQANARGFSQNVTLKVTNAPLAEVFGKITEQTGVNFMYFKGQLAGTKPVTLNFSNTPLSQVLNVCFENQPFTFSFSQDEKVVVIKSKSQSNGQLTLTVHGVVKDELGNPAQGVTVKIKGTSRGNITNAKGEFTLPNVDADATLEFSSVNLQYYEVNVSGRTEIAITLKNKIGELTAVSVGAMNNGYQTLSREKFVGSYSKLDSAAYNRRTGVSILNRLDGTIPGVIFNSKGQKAPIQIRGLSTLGFRSNGSSAAFDPLIILDNFPFDGDINTINQYDVLDITISKDAAAESIWGTRAANGVIIITTKKGRYNQPARLNFSSNVTVNSKPNLHSFSQLNSSEYINMESFLFGNGYYDTYLQFPKYYTVSPVVMILDQQKRGLISTAQAESQINNYRSIDSRDDYDKYYFKQSISQQHYLNLSGGNSAYNYSLSFGYNNNTTNIQNTKSNSQFTINSANTFRATKNLEFEVGLYLVKSKQYDYGSVSYPFTAGTLGVLPPYVRLADASGNHLAVSKDYNTAYIDTAGQGQLLDWHYRPLDEVNFVDNSISSQFAKINLGASYRFTDWIKVDLRYQYIDQSSEIRNLQSQQTYFTRNLINLYTNLSQSDPHFRYPIPYGGILDVNNTRASSQNARAQVNVNKSWNMQHQFSAMIAADISENKGFSNISRFYGYNADIGTYASGLDFYTSFPWYGSVGSATIPSDASISTGLTSRIVSLLGNTSYTFKNKYTLYISGRRDGTNVFGVNTNSKWKPLWSTGLSWDIIKEKFFNPVFLNSLRLRASYGYTGNVDNSNSGKPTMGYTGTLPYTNLVVATVGKPPNPNLRWETVKSYNFGLDFGLFQNRLSGSLDIYQKNSFDLLANTPLDATTGVTTALVNAANLKGNGLELQLRSINTKGAMRWETSMALAYNKTKVTKFYNSSLNVSSFTQYTVNPVEGQIAWGVYAYRWAGLNSSNGSPQGYFKGQVSTDYQSIVNDTIKNQVLVGSAIPQYSGFLFNSLNWYHFNLSANITYRFRYYFRKPSLNYTDLYAGINTNNEYLGRWIKTGDEAHTNVPARIYPADANRDMFYQYSEINVLKGDNIKLQDIRLSYDLPTLARLRNFVKSAQFFIYVNNLNIIIWRANKSGYDPDYTGGTSNFGYLPTKAWTFGINVSL